MNTYGDIEFTMSKFVADTTNTLCDLNFRVYPKDSTTIPDYTTVQDLNIGDIIHVFGFDINTNYKVEYYVVPDDTSIAQTPVNSVYFKTVSGICNAPIVSRDDVSGVYTITCDSTCRPAYAFRSD